MKWLNLIQQQLGQLPKDTPPYQMGSLKREELIGTNSMVLHEFYFGNLGGDGKLYEHSYAMDYGANARGYIDAFFQNLNWEEVQRRTEQARTRR